MPKVLDAEIGKKYVAQTAFNRTIRWRVSLYLIGYRSQDIFNAF